MVPIIATASASRCPWNLVHASQVCKARCPDLAPVRPLAAITDHVHTHLALGRLNSAVCLARGDSVALGVKQEVVDKRLHVLLHGGTRRWRNLVVLDLDGAGRHLVQALVDDAERLAELLHAAQVAVVAVAVDADGNVEFDLVVGVVGLRLADVPWYAGSSKHDTREGVVEGIGGRDDADALGSADPDSVVCEKLFGFVDAVAELSCPLVDVVEESEGKVLVIRRPGERRRRGGGRQRRARRIPMSCV